MTFYAEIPKQIVVENPEYAREFFCNIVAQRICKDATIDQEERIGLFGEKVVRMRMDVNWR